MKGDCLVAPALMAGNLYRHDHAVCCLTSQHAQTHYALQSQVVQTLTMLSVV